MYLFVTEIRCVGSTSIFSIIFPMREGAHESFPGGAINQIQSTYTVSNLFLLFECLTSFDKFLHGKVAK